jgi:hypothetical protein
VFFPRTFPGERRAPGCVRAAEVRPEEPITELA